MLGKGCRKQDEILLKLPDDGCSVEDGVSRINSVASHKASSSLFAFDRILDLLVVPFVEVPLVVGVGRKIFRILRIILD